MPVRPSTNELLSIFHRHLPARLTRCELSLDPTQEQPTWIDSDGLLMVALRFTTFDADDVNMPTNVKEQYICFGEYAAYAPERWNAYLEGHLRALPAIVREMASTIESALPCDFFGYSMVLSDDTLHDADDFARALSDPERLHAWNKAAVDEEWRDILQPCGLDKHVDEVRNLRRRALRMVLEKMEIDDESETRAVGESHVGGDPDLPKSFEWPEANGVLLTFVAQINLTELSHFDAADELPKQGLLSFFYTPLPNDSARGYPVRVMHFPDVSNLEKRPSPQGAEPISDYAVEFVEEQLFPAIESHYFYESLLPEAQVMAFYESLRDGKAGPEPVSFNGLSNFLASRNELHDYERPTHRLLGHPDSIQGDPYLDVEVSTRENGWDDWKEGTPEAFRIRKNALRRRLLLQIDAQEADELLLNQDGGFFYFFIPAESLAKHDWTQVCGVLQCH